MPTVLRWGPYRAFFYSNKGGEPPHVHVRSGNKEAKLWIHDLVIAVNAGFCKLVEMKLEDLVGRPITATYSGSVKPDEMLEKYRRRFEQREIETHIERILTRKFDPDDERLARRIAALAYPGAENELDRLLDDLRTGRPITI